ncbi:Fe2+-dependent dioxygenase [Brevundimonas sp.]|uniref:Fe2+-dependent dioxygenase n=1 Tax=Brevundimonas sp. TaxID=1871086 RepID=UPI001A211E9A|nr:Fe2+-dependent dioxygenase [Brevundimonas sp.]MBJ7485102.1 Fe2+-dependent dioxygenase [Brevundimonas sp.]
MLVRVPALLNTDDVARVRGLIDAADWTDGNATSGHQSALAKVNRQLPERSAAAREAGSLILDRLGQSPLFVSAALPFKVYPPLFNRYEGGEAFGVHVDNAVRAQGGSDFRIRSDLSATVFLSDPDTYDGGELVIQDTYGEQRVKLGAGDMVLYPASSLHEVTPVTRGVRVASFFWVQSMVRDDGDRRLLFELDGAVQALTARHGGRDPEVIRLTGLYHNLLRKWGEL